MFPIPQKKKNVKKDREKKEREEKRREGDTFTISKTSEPFNSSGQTQREWKDTRLAC